MPIHSGICRSCVDWRSFDEGDLAPVAEARRCDVAPGLATIAGDLNQPGVAARPHEVRIFRRRRQRVDHAVASGFRSLYGGLHVGRSISLCRIAARQVRAHLAPARAAIGCLQHLLRAQVEHLWILRRKDQRRSPGETVVALRDFRAKIFRRRRRDGLRLAGAQVKTKSAAVRAAAINDVGVAGIGHDVSAFFRADGMPIAKGDGAVIAAAGNRRGAAILLRAVNAIRKLVIYRHMIELRRRLVVPGAPSGAAIHADGRALVAAEDHALRIFRIDPKRMVIIAPRRAFDGYKSPAAINRAIKRDVRRIHHIRILGINYDLAEIPCPAVNA